MRTLFRNSSPGALTLEQARARAKENAALALRAGSAFGSPGFAPQGKPLAQSRQLSQSGGGLDGVLEGMSKDDLEEMADALNRASYATTAFEVAVGALFLLINPAALTVTITIGGLTLMTVGFSYLADKIDEYLRKK